MLQIYARPVGTRATKGLNQTFLQNEYNFGIPALPGNCSHGAKYNL